MNIFTALMINLRIVRSGPLTQKIDHNHCNSRHESKNSKLVVWNSGSLALYLLISLRCAASLLLFSSRYAVSHKSHHEWRRRTNNGETSTKLIYRLQIFQERPPCLATDDHYTYSRTHVERCFLRIDSPTGECDPLKSFVISRSKELNLVILSGKSNMHAQPASLPVQGLID